ncbi:type I restriction-modification system subunit M [Symbiopectobacterium sp. RP]|uniref:type I restriction-modification system subunit M n=1 Tax=Symbiopectobacterium sp. RP TaxID=3248553 RepID=UPI003D26A3B0
MNDFTGSAALQADFIWKNAEDLWGDFKHTDFRKIILPFTLLRRLECALEPTREAVRDAYSLFKDSDIELDTVLRSTAIYPFYNTSEYSLATLGNSKTRRNLEDYLALFSDNARAIFEEFEFGNTVIRLEKAGLLYKIFQNFAKIDLHPDVLPDRVMSNIYEHLIRRLEFDPGRDLSKNIRQGSTLSNDQFAGERFHYCLSNPPFGKKWEKDKKAVEDEHEKGELGRLGPGLPKISDSSMLFLMHLASKLELPANGGGRAAIVLSGSPLFNGGAASGESEIRRWLLENDLVETIIALPTDLFFRTNIATYLWILSNKKLEQRKEKVQLINATSLWTSIKNEGNKRRIVSDDQRCQILDMYAAGETDKLSKMLDYRTFGYRRIKVLRPLRMKLILDQEGLDRLVSDSTWLKLSSAHQSFWLDAIKPLSGQTKDYNWAETFAKDAAKSDKAKALKVKATKTLITALITAFGHKDPEAEPVTDANGELVPDAYLDESFTDARDGLLGRVGYEINFNRFFYQYEPPRKLHDIDDELKQVEAEIAALLAEVASE